MEVFFLLNGILPLLAPETVSAFFLAQSQSYSSSVSIPDLLLSFPFNMYDSIPSLVLRDSSYLRDSSGVRYSMDGFCPEQSHANNDQNSNANSNENNDKSSIGQATTTSTSISIAIAAASNISYSGSTSVMKPSRPSFEQQIAVPVAAFRKMVETHRWHLVHLELCRLLVTRY